jgi:hypothetical protein
MKRVIWLLGISALGATALLIAFRGQAAASDSASCAPADGFVVSICINVPTSAVRRETTVPLVTLPSQRADVRVEVTVAGPDALAIALGVDRSVERVETLFGQTFTARPRVLIFGSAASFSTGARELFGYSTETADRVANTYGGIFDRGTATIAVNWSASGSQRMSAAIAHELTHLMVREATGGKDIPAWLDEGIATLVEQDSAGASIATADEQLSGRAVAATGAITLTQLETVADFHAAYSRLDRPLYAYAAYATRQVGERIGWPGILAVLAATKTGGSFEAAYTIAANETIPALSRRVAADTSSAIVTTGVDASGDARWSLFAGTPSADVQVSITGAQGYSVTFTVRTDSLGMYRGSFGSTAAAGTYTVRAAGTSATFSTAR